MRKNRENQLPLTSLWPDHQLSYELQMISRILDDNPEILDLVLQDLSDKTDPQKGSPGLSAEQVLRCAVLKTWQQLSYQKLAAKTAHYTRVVLQSASQWEDIPSLVIVGKLRHYLHLMQQVIKQTERRVLQGEKVPAAEKVVSIFEEHTDIIQTGGRETTFGHKIFLTCGKTSLLTDCLVLRGNPADSAQMKPMLKRHHQLYGRYPRQASFDGGFATQDNLRWAKKQGIVDVAFAKKGRLKVSEMVRSSWVYRQLRRFRAGIEGCISMLKRVFGANRCTWKGWEHFQQYLHLSVLSFNLLVLARLRL